MAQPFAPLPSITVTPLAKLIARTAYYKLLAIRSQPPHLEPTVLDFLVSTQGLTAWVLAQHEHRERHPHRSHVDIEAFLREIERHRNELVLTTRSLLEKSSEGFVRAQRDKEEMRRKKLLSRKMESWDESKSS